MKHFKKKITLSTLVVLLAVSASSYATTSLKYPPENTKKSADVQAYETQRGLFAPKDAVKQFQHTGVAQEYYGDIFHSAFEKDIEAMAKHLKRGRFFDAGAGNGNGLMQLQKYFHGHKAKFSGVGINYPDVTPIIDAKRAQVLGHKGITIIEDNLGNLQHPKYSMDYAGRTKDGYVKGKTKPKSHQLKHLKGTFTGVTDSVGAMSYTRDVENTLKNSLSMLVKGGVYHGNLSWKMQKWDSLNYYWAKDWKEADSLHKKPSKYLYSDADFGYSILIDPDEKSTKAMDKGHKIDDTFYSTQALRRLAIWLASFKGVKLSLETSNEVHAATINRMNIPGLGKVIVNPKYQAWENRYGLQKCKPKLPYVFKHCTYNSMGLKVKSASVAGVKVITDKAGARYLEMEAVPTATNSDKYYRAGDYYKPAPKSAKKNALALIANKKVDHKVYKTMLGTYSSLRRPFDLSDSNLGKEIYRQQQHYGAFLFIRMVRTHGPVTAAPMESIFKNGARHDGRPDHRVFFTKHYNGKTVHPKSKI